jgi:hypothetical protein
MRRGAVYQRADGAGGVHGSPHTSTHSGTHAGTNPGTYSGAYTAPYCCTYTSPYPSSYSGSFSGTYTGSYAGTDPCTPQPACLFWQRVAPQSCIYGMHGHACYSLMGAWQAA